MKLKILTAMVLVVALMGCAHVREWSLDLAQSDTKNAQAVRDVSQELMNGWPTWSGLLKGILGDRVEEFPLRALKAWVELDALTYCHDSSKYPEDFFTESPSCTASELTDYELGYYSGTRLRMLYETVIEAVKLYAPDIIGKLPVEMLGVL